MIRVTIKCLKSIQRSRYETVVVTHRTLVAAVDEHRESTIGTEKRPHQEDSEDFSKKHGCIWD